MRRPNALLVLLALLAAFALGTAPALAAQGHDKRDHSRTTTTTSTTKSKADRTHATSTTRKRHRSKTTGTAKTTGGSISDKQGEAVINDCQSHGQLTKSWSAAQLRKALAVMSPSTKQYSNCESVIQQALAHKTGSGGGTGGGGGSSTGTIVVIVVIVIVLLAALFGGLALRRRRAAGPASGSGGLRVEEDPTRVRPPDGE